MRSGFTERPSPACRRAKVAVVSASVAMLAGISAAAQTPTAEGPASAPTQTTDDAINPDRPGIADGSAVIGRGRLQLETGFQQEFRREGGSTERRYFVPTLLRVGLSAHWEARMESNTFTHVDASPAGAIANQTSGLAPISLGVKFQIQGSAGLHQPSLGTIIRVFPASGTDGLHTNHATGDLRLAADWDLTPRLSLNPNVGVALYEDDRSRAFTAGLYALTLNFFNAAKTINPFVDTGIQTPEASASGSSVIVDGGIAYLPGRNVQIDLSGGAGLHGRAPPHGFFSVGISLRFRASERGTTSTRGFGPNCRR